MICKWSSYWHVPIALNGMFLEHLRDPYADVYAMLAQYTPNGQTAKRPNGQTAKRPNGQIGSSDHRPDMPDEWTRTCHLSGSGALSVMQGVAVLRCGALPPRTACPAC